MVVMFSLSGAAGRPQCYGACGSDQRCMQGVVLLLGADTRYCDQAIAH